MKFKSIAIPVASQGEDFTDVIDQVVPDQSMSLEEILHRFTRNESLPVAMQAEYGDDDIENPLNVDLEKMATADLVDKEQFTDQLKEVKKAYEKQEKEKVSRKQKADAEKAEAERLKAIQEEVERRLKQSSESAHS